jgi:hypothetical protein
MDELKKWQGYCTLGTVNTATLIRARCSTGRKHLWLWMEEAVSPDTDGGCEYIAYKPSRITDQVWFSKFGGWSRGLKILTLINEHLIKYHAAPRTWIYPLVL